MSERRSYNPMFDLQQNLLAQGQRAFRQGMDMQGQAMEAFVRGLETGESSQQWGTDLSRRYVDTYFDMLEATFPGEEFDLGGTREMMVEQFDVFDEMRGDTWSSFHDAMREGTDAYREFTDEYVEMVDSSFEAFTSAYRRTQRDASGR